MQFFTVKIPRWVERLFVSICFSQMPGIPIFDQQYA